MKVGPKERQLAELRAKGAVPKHVDAMIEAGAPLAIIRMPNDPPPEPLPPVTTGGIAQDATRPATALPAADKTEEHPPQAAGQSAGTTHKDEPAMTTTTAKKTTTTSKPKAKAKSTERRKPAKKATAAARKPAGDKPKAPKQPKGMVVKILEASTTTTGVSRAELDKLTGWKGSPWKWLFSNPKKTGYCDRWGYKLEVIEGKEGETRYKTTKVK